MGRREEPVFAGMLWRCVAIVREYGQKIGKDPFDLAADPVELDEETEQKLSTPELDFCHYDYSEEALCRKTLDYVRRNQDLFK